MIRDHAKHNNDGEAVLRLEARHHDAARRDIYSKIKALDHKLDVQDKRSKKDLVHLAQLANAYHRLQHAIAILKEIAHRNGVNPDTLFLENESLRVSPERFTAEDIYELRDIVRIFVAQQQFEDVFDTGLKLRLTADKNGVMYDGDRELTRYVLPAHVGDSYPDITEEGVQIIIRHFNTMSIPLGVMETVLTRDGRNLPMIHEISGPWKTEI